MRDDRFGWVLSLMIWALIAYMVIPMNIADPGAEVDDMSKGNPLYRTIKLSLLALSGCFILWRPALSWLLLRWVNPFFIAFILLVAASLTWSIAPHYTIGRLVTMFSIVLPAFAFCLTGWHARRFQNVLRPVLTLIFVASLVVGIINPNLVTEVGDTISLSGSWRGLTSQKNVFGQISSFGVILWISGFIARDVKWWKALLGAAVSGICLVLSRSSTSLLATILVAGLMLLLIRAPPNLRRYMPIFVGLFAIITVIYAVAVLKLVPGLELLLTPITAITGKDLTFSNRTEIWAIVNENIDVHPIIGSGYGAYWIGPVPWSPSYVFLSRMYFYPTECHNGYLEIVNDLGFLGLVVLFGYLFTFVRQSLQLMRIDRSQGALYLCLFFQQAIMNLSESSWLYVSSASFDIMALATLCLARGLLEHRLRLYFGQAAPAPGAGAAGVAVAEAPNIPDLSAPSS
jgi:O-antigen ligase